MIVLKETKEVIKKRDAASDKTILNTEMNGFFVTRTNAGYVAKTGNGKPIAYGSSLEQLEATIKQKLTRTNKTTWPYILYLHTV